MMKRLLLAATCLLPIVSSALAQSVPVKYDSAASTNSTLVRAGAVQINLITVTNTNAAVYYLKLYDGAVAPTCGTSTVVFKVAVPLAASGGQLIIPITDLSGLRFFNGVGFCLTGALADNDTTVAATGVTINFGVKQ
jgi:hypothetical protein